MYTLDQLRCFVSVAEELHFGKAAARMHMTQPPLSRQIQKLERDLEVHLLDRSPSGVTLTAAGHSFLHECYRILENVETAPRRAKLIAEGKLGLVRIGYTAISGFSVLGEILSSLKAQLPDLKVELKELVTPLQIDALENESIDIGLGRPPFVSDVLSSFPIRRDKLVIAVPSGHPLGGNGIQVSLDEIKNHPMIMYSPNDAKYFHNLVTLELGIDPHQGEYQVTQATTILALVAQGLGIAIVPSSTMSLERSDVQYLDIAERTETNVELHAAWHLHSKNPALQPVLEIIRAIGQSQ
ncbi:MAG: LysR family transcriptional regulator [Micrococcaceae bacterium]